MSNEQGVQVCPSLPQAKLATKAPSGRERWVTKKEKIVMTFSFYIL
jgi:hypothetical protein